MSTFFRLLFNAAGFLGLTSFPVFAGFGVWIAFFHAEPWMGGLVMVTAGLCGVAGLFFLNAAKREA